MRGLKLEMARKTQNQYLSHLLQMRGLKRTQRITFGCPAGVASFTDAWIETIIGNITLQSISPSHLLQMRGLKLENEYKQNQYRLSHLLQMRGLKHDAELA